MTKTVRRAATAAVAAAALLLAHPGVSLGYLKLGYPLADGRMAPVAWAQTPVRYFVTNTGVSGVGPGDLRDAVGRAFSTWEAVPTASISYTFAGFTDASPDDEDGQTTLGFLDRPDLDGVLASTNFMVDAGTGALLEADIFFNASYPWSAAAGTGAPSAAGGGPAYDLQSIALHEIGHLNGLGHSALGETELAPVGRRVVATDAVMFPIAFPPGTVLRRTLDADDIAGISDLYPAGGFADRTGSLSGRVVKQGQGVYGAHVVAFDVRTGTMVGGFTLDDDGRFSIGGLSPGPHVVRVEPLDDADPFSFFDGEVDLAFKVTVYPRLVVVPRAGDSGSILIQVPPA